LRLALEIPTEHLAEFSSVTDLDYALAHEVLANPVYAAFYEQQRRKGRRVILDNGMYEKGDPLNTAEILEAASRINPSVIIPRDKLGDANFTLEGFKEMLRHPDRQAHWKVALVIQGTSFNERVALFNACRELTDTMMLPFREPRLDWFHEFVEKIPSYIAWPPFLHLLGVNELVELVKFNEALHMSGWPAHRISVDTGKPFKWASRDSDMSQMDSVRSGGLVDLTSKFDVARKLLAYKNIAYLRTYMS
jgi:hypothetical protein